MINHTTIEEARRVKLKAVALLRKKGLLGAVGITRIRNGYALKINLQSQALPALPKELDGVPLIIEIIGKIRPRGLKSHQYPVGMN